MDLKINNGLEFTSNFIADFIGKKHNKVMRDIKEQYDNIKHLDEECIRETTYVNSRGKTYPNFTLTKDGLMLVVTKYSDEHRFKLIKYCRELESKLDNKPKLPTTYLEALEQLVEKEKLLIEQQPKVEYHDKVLDTDTCYTTTQLAKEFEMTARRLNLYLEQADVHYKQSGQWLLKAKYQDKGLVRTRTHLYKNSKGKNETRHYTVWTEKGRQFISDFLEDL